MKIKLNKMYMYVSDLDVINKLADEDVDRLSYIPSDDTGVTIAVKAISTGSRATGVKIDYMQGKVKVLIPINLRSYHGKMVDIYTIEENRIPGEMFRIRAIGFDSKGDTSIDAPYIKKSRVVIPSIYMKDVALRSMGDKYIDTSIMDAGDVSSGYIHLKIVDIKSSMTYKLFPYSMGYRTSPIGTLGGNASCSYLGLAKHDGQDVLVFETKDK